MKMHAETKIYHDALNPDEKAVCDALYTLIENELPEAEHKIWHAHPVWFLDGNPVVGYSKQKPGIRLMFWSGADFDEAELNVKGKKFKDASVFFNRVSEIEPENVRRWVRKSREIQWDYKNLVKRKGSLERLF
jgi:uncharacterized protein YdhG (YjbR/CyaY superfamily)